MTQSVLESMARAIYDITYGHSDPTETPFAWSQSVSAARAALIALRDGVTEEMLDYDATDKITGSEPWNPRPSAAFPLIINHVLQEGEKDKIPQGAK